MRLVGRERELTAIDRMLGRAVDHHGELLVVIGQAGSGKTALADAAAERARQRGFTVLRALPAAVPGDRSLVVVDDVDGSSADALARFGTMLPGSETAAVVTAGAPIGIGPELHVGPLRRVDFDELFPDLDDDGRQALFLASRGMPGPALELAPGVEGTDDPFVALALRLASTAPFLELDVALVGLLETAVERPAGGPIRARLLARLARELLGDATAAERRRALVDEAAALAGESGDDRVVAEVLDARLHALWDPTGADDRLATAGTIVDLARRSGDLELEQRGLFWRFAALMELGRVADAEATLAAYARAGAAAGDAEAAAIVTARHAMLATIRGQFAEARRLTEAFAEDAARLGLADADRLVATLRAGIGVELGASELPGSPEELLGFARRQPGNLYDATAAFALAFAGRTAEAGAELARCLPRALRAEGPRWLRAMVELGTVAAATANGTAMATITEALLPYRDRLVVSGGANSCMGPAARHLGLLALQLGRHDAAIGFLVQAAAMEEHAGLLPGLANTSALLADALARRGRGDDRALAAEHRRRADALALQLGLVLLVDRIGLPTGAWSLLADDGDWMLVAGDERARLRDGRGVHYLRALLAAPGREIAALDLVAGGAGLAAAVAEPILDEEARSAYQQRLLALEDELDAADRAGDGDRAARAEAERAALIGELRRATGLGGRPRVTTDEAERARVNVTRTLRATIERITAAAPLAGAHLGTSIRTGRSCCYQPASGGPPDWRL